MGFTLRPLINKVIRKIYIETETIFNKAKTKYKFIYSTNKKSCKIQLINKVPLGSIAVVGHAFGSHDGSEKRNNISFSPKLDRFFKENKNSLNIVIFSGDILKEPSFIKWNNFFKNFNSETSIYIAPGNHDVGKYEDSSLRDVFNIVTNKLKIPNKYPFYFLNKKSLYIIDDSNKKESNIEEFKSIILTQKGLDNIFIIRHHVLPYSLKKYGNSSGISPHLNDKYFTNIDFKDSTKNLTFIYGDGGAFPYQERISCFNIGETKHIVNGIGDQPGDTILIINDDKIYRKEI